MFQYAIGYCLSKKKNTPLFFDTRLMEQHKIKPSPRNVPRDFDLDVFDIKKELVNKKELFINLGVFCVALVLGLVLAESFLRVWSHPEKYNLAKYPKKLFTRESPSHLRPGFIGHFPKSEIHGKIEINSKGLRDLETSYHRKEKSLSCHWSRIK